MGWVEWGGELIWAVGFTAGGAPFGLRASEFDPGDLRTIGLEDATLALADAWVEESGDWPPNRAGPPAGRKGT